MIDTAVDILIYACLVPMLTFVVLYGIRSIWYESWTGRWAFGQATCLAILQAVVVLAITFPDWSARPYIRFAVYLLLFVVQCGGVAVLVYQQTRKPPTTLR